MHILSSIYLTYKLFYVEAIKMKDSVILFLLRNDCLFFVYIGLESFWAVKEDEVGSQGSQTIWKWGKGVARKSLQASIISQKAHWIHVGRVLLSGGAGWWALTVLERKMGEHVSRPLYYLAVIFKCRYV